jgi:hypothetical protein
MDGRLNFIRLPGRLRSETLARWVFIMSIVGYPTLLLILGCFGFDSKAVALSYRGAVALAALGAIFQSWKKKRPSWWGGALVGFLAWYGARLAINLVQGSPFALAELGFFCLALCLPSLAILSGSSPERNFEPVKPMQVLAASTALAALACEYLGWIGDKSKILTGRLSSMWVDPITLGSACAILVVATLAQHSWKTPMEKVKSAGWILLGLMILGCAATRGPLLALVGSLGCFLFLPNDKKTILRQIFLISILTGLAVYLFQNNPLKTHLIERGFQREFYQTNQKEKVFAKTFANRPEFNRFSSYNLSSELRPIFWEKSWFACKENPWMGIGNWAVFKADSGHHPHNVFLEAYQNLGLVGGTLFVCLMGASARSAWLWLRTGKVLVPALFTQALILAQVSGSLFGQVQLILCAAVLLREKPTREPNHLSQKLKPGSKTHSEPA